MKDEKKNHTPKGEKKNIESYGNKEPWNFNSHILSRDEINAAHAKYVAVLTNKSE